MNQIIYVLIASTLILVIMYIVQHSFKTSESFDVLRHMGLRPTVNRHARYMRKRMEHLNKTYMEPFKVSLRKRKLI